MEMTTMRNALSGEAGSVRGSCGSGWAPIARHAARPPSATISIARIDAQGALYVDLGSATNSCQVENRMPNSPGIQPCTELETRAGIWRYEANRTGQRFSPTERFATGLRNGEGIAFDSAGRIFATQHGRDQLRENWPRLYTPEQGAKERAEERKKKKRRR